MNIKNIFFLLMLSIISNYSHAHTQLSQSGAVVGGTPIGVDLEDQSEKSSTEPVQQVQAPKEPVISKQIVVSTADSVFWPYAFGVVKKVGCRRRQLEECEGAIKVAHEILQSNLGNDFMTDPTRAQSIIRSGDVGFMPVAYKAFRDKAAYEMIGVFILNKRSKELKEAIMYGLPKAVGKGIAAECGSRLITDNYYGRLVAKHSLLQVMNLQGKTHGQCFANASKAVVKGVAVDLASQAIVEQLEQRLGHLLPAPNLDENGNNLDDWTTSLAKEAPRWLLLHGTRMLVDSAYDALASGLDPHTQKIGVSFSLGDK